MRLKPSTCAFVAFAAFFAALAAFVFWGTWGLDAAPVMPDCPVAHPADRMARWIDGFLATGKFVPGDLKEFLGSPYFWQELQYAIALFMAALGLAYFLKGRGLSRAASYGAGLLLAFSGYWCSLFSAGHLGWFQWMTYGVFAFALADRAARKGKLRHWILLGATLAWGSCYQPDMWLLFTVFTAAYFVFESTRTFLRERGNGSAKIAAKRFALGAAAALAVFVAIGLPSFRSAIVNDLAGRDRQIASGETVAAKGVDEAEKRWIFVTNWSMPPEDTLEFFIPRIKGDTSCPSVLALGARQGTGVKPYTGRLGRPFGAPAGNYRQHSLYVGFLTCILAILACVKFRKTPTVVFFAAAAVVFWLFSMGRYCEPVYRIVYSLPMGDYLRAPVKWHHLTEFCLVALAGFGLEAVRGFLAAKGLKPRMAAYAVFAIAVAGAADLARVDSRFCAAMDLKGVRSPNPAAEKVKSLGGGKVFDFIGGGASVVSWMFSSKGVEMTTDAGDARFALVSLDQMKDARFAPWLKAKRAETVAYYSVTSKGVRDAEPRNAALLLFPGVPKPPEPAEKSVSSGTVALAAVSVAATLATLLFALSSACRPKRGAAIS